MYMLVGTYVSNVHINIKFIHNHNQCQKNDRLHGRIFFLSEKQFHVIFKKNERVYGIVNIIYYYFHYYLTLIYFYLDFIVFMTKILMNREKLLTNLY